MSSTQIELIRLGLQEELAEDFDRAVRRRKLLREQAKPQSPEEWLQRANGIKANDAETLNVLYRCWPGVGKAHTVGAPHSAARLWNLA